MVIGKRLRIEGMLVCDHQRPPAAVRHRGRRLAARRASCSYRETVVDGIENGVEAFLGLLRGDNTGKMIVKLDA